MLFNKIDSLKYCLIQFNVARKEIHPFGHVALWIAGGNPRSGTVEIKTHVFSLYNVVFFNKIKKKENIVSV